MMIGVVGRQNLCGGGISIVVAINLAAQSYSVEIERSVCSAHSHFSSTLSVRRRRLEYENVDELDGNST